MLFISDPIATAMSPPDSLTLPPYTVGDPEVLWAPKYTFTPDNSFTKLSPSIVIDSGSTTVLSPVIVVDVP